MATQSLEIVYFGNDWYAENKTSSHHVAEQLAKHHKILYIECPGLRAPTRSGRDFKKLWAKLLKGLQRPRPLTPNLTVCTLLQIPFHQFAIIRRLNQAITRTLIKRRIKSCRFNKPLLWFVVPHLSHIIRHIPHALSIYYCIDDYSALPGVNYNAIKAMDKQLCEQADLVFTASQELFALKKTLNKNVMLAEHGVDFSHFKQASQNITLAKDIANIKQPIIGFFGLIEAWIDVDLICNIAKCRPDWQIVLIGRCAVDGFDPSAYQNIHYLGHKSFAELPSYAAAFNVALLPYRLTRQVLHCNPIKLREYLATGTPVVSVRFPEAERYGNLIYIADSHTDFVEKIEQALSNDSETAAQARISSVSGQTWENKISQVLKIVNQHLYVIKSQG